jgi:hypothetical protein
MNESRPIPRPAVVGGIVLLLVALSWLGWYALWPRTAPPGRLPAVPTPGVRAAPVQGGVRVLEDGAMVPHLSAADAAKIKRGEAVEIKVPGGSLTVGPPKKEKSK